MASEPENNPHKEYRSFFAHIGVAITRWAYVDRELFELCAFCLKTDERKVAVVFYRSPQISDHITLLGHLMPLSVESDLASEWKSLSSRLSALLNFRNEIAHNPPMQALRLDLVLRQPGEAPPTEAEDAVIVAPTWSIRTEPSKLLRGRQEVVTQKAQIAEHIALVNQLMDELTAFHDKLRKQPPK